MLANDFALNRFLALPAGEQSPGPDLAMGGGMGNNGGASFGGGGSGGGGMDAWQQSVEKRLDKYGDGITDLKVEIATLSERVSSLPTKEWVGQQFRNWIIGVGAFLSIVTVAARFIGH